MTRRKLTDKETIAVQEYFDNGLNKRKAMDKAGYSKETAPNKVFNTPAVKAEMALHQKSLARKHDIKQDDIIAELAKMTFYGVGDLIEVDSNGDASLDFTKLTDNHRAGIKSFTSKTYKEGKGKDARDVKETKIEFVSKIAAQEALSKHMGFHDKGDEGAKDLIDALVAAKKRIRIQIDDMPEAFK